MKRVHALAATRQISGDIFTRQALNHIPIYTFSSNWLMIVGHAMEMRLGQGALS
jgi:hypothetical protein